MYLGEKTLGNFREKTKRPKSRAYRQDPEHLEFIRSLPSCLSGEYGCDPHHLLSAPGRGVGLKAPDWWTVPLARMEHDRLHRECGSKTEEEWFVAQGVMPHILARTLWHLSGDHEACEFWVLCNISKKGVANATGS